MGYDAIFVGIQHVQASFEMESHQNQRLQMANNAVGIRIDAAMFLIIHPHIFSPSRYWSNILLSILVIEWYVVHGIPLFYS